MYLHGAHVTSWKPAGRDEVFFLSSQSRWENGRAIRGGVPYVSLGLETRRTTPKRRRTDSCERKRGRLSRSRKPKAGSRVSMFTESDEEYEAMVAGRFSLVHRATFGSELSLNS